MEQQPDYCAWVLKLVDEEEDLPERMVAFAKWLQEQVQMQDMGSNSVGFGKHKDLTYQEAMELQPDYCAWVLKQAGGEDTMPGWRRSPVGSKSRVSGRQRPKGPKEGTQARAWASGSTRT